MMTPSEATLLMLAFCLLRLTLTILVTLIFGFFMNRLIDHLISQIEL